MNLKVYFSGFHYKKHYGLFERLLYFVLLPLSEVYKCIVLVRDYLYKRNVLKSYKASARVISIGNITTGGTGKTPIVSEFASYLATNPANKVAILSRGYGKRNKHEITVVKANNRMLVNHPKECGDEAFMLADMLDDVLILTGSKRSKLAEIAVEKYNCNILILDDGLQHKALARDLDIVIIDQENLLGNRKLLPLGPLRDPISRLNEADVIIWTNKSGKKLQNKTTLSDLLDTNKPEYYAEYDLKGFTIYPEKAIVEKINDQRVFAFTGIGQPASFFNQLMNAGIVLNGTLIFPDHKDYVDSDIERINKEARNANAHAIVTTEKDIVKLSDYINVFELPIYVTIMKMKINVKELLEDLKF